MKLGNISRASAKAELEKLLESKGYLLASCSKQQRH